ncbi:MAG: glycosyltransferase family 4 protein [Patescibacteria group bacterium]
MSLSILHVAPFFSPKVGGVETHVAAVAAEQVRLGNQVVVITQAHLPGLVSEEQKNGVQIFRLPISALGKKLQTWSAIWKLRHHFLGRDRIYIHDVGWWLLPVALHLNTGFAMVFHGWEGVYPVRWQAQLHRWFLAQFAWRVIHVGSFIGRFYWDAAHAVIFGGVAQKNTKPIAKKRSKRKVKIIFIGRLEEDTAVRQYYALAKLLRKRGVAYDLTWVGDGSLAEECAQVGTVTGFKKNVDVNLIQADVVWAASYLSILQAQAHGKLVVGLYSNPLKQEYLRSYPGAQSMIIGSNVETVATTLQAVLKNTQRWSQIERGAWEFARDQSWTKVATIYEAVWRK